MLTKTEMAVMPNAKTGSEFRVIGNVDDISCGVRFWIEPRKDAPHTTMIGYRFRFAMDPAVGTTPLSFKLYIDSKCPAAKWAGMSETHVSLAGFVSVPHPVWKYDEVITELQKCEVGNKLHSHLLHLIGHESTMPTVEDFSEYFMSEVKELMGVKATLPLTDAEVKSVVIDFGTFKKHYQQGFEVTPVLPTGGTADSSGYVPGHKNGDGPVDVGLGTANASGESSAHGEVESAPATVSKEAYKASKVLKAGVGSVDDVESL